MSELTETGLLPPGALTPNAPTLATLPPPKVYAAIARVTAELSKSGIAKDRKNVQQGYQFRGIDDIYCALSPLLASAGLCILPRVLSREVVERQGKGGGALFYTTVEVEFDFVSAEDGSRHTVLTYGEAMDSGDKSTNKAMSAAYKYACLQAFCIPTEGDNDADATTHEVAPTKRAPLFTSAALRKTFCENVMQSFAAATTVEELKELKALNMEKMQQMKESGNEHDLLGYEEIGKRYAAALARVKAGEARAQQVADSYGQGFASANVDSLIGGGDDIGY